MKLLKIAKRVFSAVTVLTATLAQMTSCDSREDWFAKEGEGATFIIKTSKSSWWEDKNTYEQRIDTVNSDYYKLVEYNLKVNEVKCVKNNTKVDYKSENLFLDIEGYGRKVNRNSHSKLDVVEQPHDPKFVCYEDKNWFYFTGTDGNAPATRNDTIAPVLNTAEVIMELEDAFKNKIYCHVKINCLGDVAPVPVMEVKDIEGSPMEKMLSLSGSYDIDGSVSMYEYCIDGEIRPYSKPVYDCDPKGVPSGKGAYGGTYIKATDLSEAKHAFQTEGEHIVYYRCMDNIGLWSLWNSVTVTIE